MAETIGAIGYHSVGKTPLASFARPLLGRLFDELKQAALRDRNDYRHLHGTRIVGKRLRYTIEMFIDCFGPALRTTLYPAIAEMQEVLGDVNDHFNAVQLYAALGTKLGVFLSPHGRRYQAFVDRLKARRESATPGGLPAFSTLVGELAESGDPSDHRRTAIQRPAAWHVFHEAENAIAAPHDELKAAASPIAMRTA